MENNPKNTFYLFFILAFLLHVSFLTGFLVNFKLKPKQFELPTLPAYIYREEKFNPQSVQQHLMETEKQKPVSKVGIEKPQPEKTQVAQSKTETLSMGNGLQNVNLRLKAKNNMDKPLLNIITKAVAAHLSYPKVAMDFRLRGRALVGFILYPDGHLTDVTLLQTSGTEVLDEAAVAAVSAISPLKNVQAYVDKPESLMMGIIFQ